MEIYLVDLAKFVVEWMDLFASLNYTLLYSLIINNNEIKYKIPQCLTANTNRNNRRGVQHSGLNPKRGRRSIGRWR